MAASNPARPRPRSPSLFHVARPPQAPHATCMSFTACPSLRASSRHPGADAFLGLLLRKIDASSTRKCVCALPSPESGLGTCQLRRWTPLDIRFARCVPPRTLCSYPACRCTCRCRCSTSESRRPDAVRCTTSYGKHPTTYVVRYGDDSAHAPSERDVVHVLRVTGRDTYATTPAAPHAPRWTALGRRRP
ncbi:hypothetical protein K466DRAFT_390041 [Polyporus arcularius HHB13444]|uniref:Uncharacterized protein n=1 Tax=Polyporus arcularius HHB13444 TaxID=1314778 RepID=A0A5C3PW96_9APHY|nr:hypothetical protein K466DRAFT_390041 [Polyporus arcularius HHB13444]